MGGINELLNSESKPQKLTLDWTTEKEVKETLTSNRFERLIDAIENIDNEVIKSNMLFAFENETIKSNILPVLENEVIIYNRNIKRRLSDEWLSELMKKLLSNREKKILPSELKEHFDEKIYKQIEAEIPNIDNEKIKGNIEYFYENKSLYIPDVLLKEINIYNNNIKPRLSNEWLRWIFNLVLSIKNKRVMPSYIKNQFDIYEELNAVEDPGAKKVISRYLGKWVLPSFVKEEYEIYTAIEQQESGNETRKKYLLWLMQNGERPKDVDARIDFI